VGLSAMTKLAPARVAGMMMGLFFVSISIGDYLAGTAASLYESLPLPTLFGVTVCISLGAAAVLVLLVILPFWTSLLIRIYAWMNILQREGPLNDLLMALHLVSEPPAWLSTDTAIFIGVVYSYLPFMVLPLYATLEKFDETLIEAAADLGCPRWKIFWQVTLPLSSSGMLAGVLLCFIPIVGEFVIPDLLGGSESPMIGQTIWMEFFSNRDWPVASAVAVVLVCLLVTPIVIYQHQAMRVVERD